MALILDPVMPISRPMLIFENVAKRDRYEYLTTVIIFSSNILLYLIALASILTVIFHFIFSDVSVFK